MTISERKELIGGKVALIGDGYGAFIATRLHMKQVDAFTTFHDKFDAEKRPRCVEVLKAQNFYLVFFPLFLSNRYPEMYKVLLLSNPITDLSALASNSETQGKVQK